jgi:hypothetical protein
MSELDLRFDDVVIESTKMIGPRGTYHTAVCRQCSTQHEATHTELAEKRLYVDSEEIKYVAEMRAWNCCNEDNTPLDGFPEDPR